MVQKEWVREQHLVEELRIAPKLLLRALRYLELERILRHDSRKEGKRLQAREAALQPKKEGDKETEGDMPPKPMQQTYWAIDYPSFWDVLRLRLHLMRFKIKSEVDDSNVEMSFVCPQCDNRYTSLDFMTLLNRKTGQMICEECGVNVVEEFGNDNGSGNVEDRRKKRDDSLKKMETELRSILDLVHQAKDVKPPDFGSFNDWQYEQNAKLKARQNQGTTETRSEDEEATMTSAKLQTSKVENKELPPWMVKTTREDAAETENMRRELKRKVAEVLPPPLSPAPTVKDTPPVELPSTASLAPIVPSAIPSTANKRIRIVISNVDPPKESVPDEDDLEWEDVGVDTTPASESPFDAEAARLADLESDMRTRSGWQTLRKR